MSSGNPSQKPANYPRNRSRQQQERAVERRKQFTPRKRTSESEDDGTCDLCVQSIKVYAIGHCDHPICFRCSAKMRVLCEQNHCAVCRLEMKKVIYCKSRRPFSEANALNLIQHGRNNVWFTDKIVKNEYETLFQHRCPICPDHLPESSLENLESHMRKKHTLFFCKICIQHNTNFTDECKTYTREDLAKHRRVGDDDDSSHKGHPLCEFCDERYLDKDSLLHHLRKDHYFCHFCDQEGRNQYYNGYVDLRDHYRNEHFLCEEGDCINEQFTSVFATELDLKAHRAAAHNQSMSKQQQKVERNIDLGFQYSNPPARGGRGGSNRGRGRGRGGGGRNDNSRRDDDLELAKALSLSEHQNAKKDADKSRGDRPRLQRDEQPKKQPEPEEPAPLDLVNDFPTLGSSEKDEQKDPFAYTSIHKKPAKPVEDISSREAQTSTQTTASKIAVAMGRSVGKITQEDFPTLGSQKKSGSSQPTGIWAASTPVTPSKPAPAKVQKPVSVNMASSKYSKARVDVANKDEFPTLGGGKGNATSLLVTTWGQTASAPTSRKNKNAKTPIANHESVKKKPQAAKIAPAINHEPSPTPKSTPAAVHDNSQVTYDDTVSIRIGSHKHTMRLTSTKYSDQIDDIEKPIEVPGISGTSVKTVSADTFSLLSNSANSSSRQSGASVQNFGSRGGDFPELGGGQGGRIRGIGPARSSSGTPWGQSTAINQKVQKKSKFSLSDLSRDIAAKDETPTYPTSKTSDAADFHPTEDDFLTKVTKAPPLSSYSATWRDEPSLSVADTIIKEKSFAVQEGDFPSLGGGSKNSQNSGKKNKKKKKNKGPPSVSDISKHFGSVSIDNGNPNSGHLANLIKTQKGTDQKSLSTLLDKNDIFAAGGNGETSLRNGVNEDPASQSTVENSETQEEPLDPRPDESDIDGRNLWLTNTICQLCGNEENFSEFKSASGAFRQGNMLPKKYYEKCRVLLGRTHFDEVFMELVALLPDEDKQNALKLAHESW